MSKYLDKSLVKLFVDSPSLNFKNYLSYLLFDEDFYFSRNTDVKKNAFAHYIKEGALQGRCPHVLFDPVFYKANYQDKGSKTEPLKDYMKQKGKVVSPHPLFDAAYYVQQLKDNSLSVPNDQTLLEHFLETGWKEGVSPSPYFDFDYYYSEYPDVKSAGVNPMLHYLLFGEEEGRQPNEDFDPSSYAKPPKPAHWNTHAFESRGKLTFQAIMKEEQAAFLNNPGLLIAPKKASKKPLNSQFKAYESAINTFFDEEYYTQVNWDIRNIDLHPAEHYIKFGSQEGRCPNPLFDPAYYREKHLKELVEDKVEDEKGEKSEKKKAKKKKSKKLDPAEEPIIHYLNQPNDKMISPHPLFDAEYYTKQLKEHSIPVPTGETLLEHFLKEGWKQNISPSPEFDFEYYFKENPELEKAGFINPLIHYLTHGEQAGLCPNDEFNPKLIQKPALEANKDNPVYLNDSKLAMAVKGQLGVSAQVMRFKRQLSQLDKDKPMVICMTHEASRTGAPAIILKLAEDFRDYLDCNVVCLLGYGGDVAPDFKAVGPSYQFERWHPWANEGLPEEIGMVLNILQKYHPIGVLLNSAESRNMLPHFRYRNIPSVALIHEMGYVYPEGMFGVIAKNADFTIFPSQIVCDLANENSKFPQGKTKVRGQGLLKPEILEIDRAKSEVALRKMLGLPEDAFIVMGCGSLTRRKGPEFFVNTAIHVLQAIRREQLASGELTEEELELQKIFEPLVEEIDEAELESKPKTKVVKTETKNKKKRKIGKREIHFIWLGGKHPMVQEDFFWMERDIETAGVSNFVHFLGTRTHTEK